MLPLPRCLYRQRKGWRTTMAYDPAVHSKHKLGHIGTIPVTPTMPIAGQVGAGGALHLRLMGDSYVTGTLRGAIPINRAKAIGKAIAAGQREPSYSGSSSEYVRLETVPAEDGRTCELRCGGVKVATVYVDPSHQIMSTDELLAEQLEAGEDEDEDEDEDPDE